MSKTELKQALLKFKHTDYKATRTELLLAYRDLHYPKEIFKNYEGDMLLKDMHSSFDNAVRKLMKDGEIKRYVKTFDTPVETPKSYIAKRQMRKVVMFELVKNQNQN